MPAAKHLPKIAPLVRWRCAHARGWHADERRRAMGARSAESPSTRSGGISCNEVLSGAWER